MMIRRAAAAFAATVLAVLALSTTTAQASAPAWTAHTWRGTTCVADSYNTFHDRIKVVMIVRNRNDNRHYATRLRVKARLIPTTAGLNYTRPWHSVKWPGVRSLNRNTTYSHLLGVNTQSVSLDTAWKVQVKLIWDRTGGWTDVVQQYSYKVDGCSTGVVGGG